MITLTIPATGPIHFSATDTLDSEPAVRDALGRGRQYRKAARGTVWVTERRNVADLLSRLVERFGAVVLAEADTDPATVAVDTVAFYARNIRSNAQWRRARLQERRRNAQR